MISGIACILIGTAVLAMMRFMKNEPFMKNARSGHGIIEEVIESENSLRYKIRFEDDDKAMCTVTCEYAKTGKYGCGDEVNIRYAIWHLPLGMRTASVRLKSRAVAKTDMSRTYMAAGTGMIVFGAIILLLAIFSSR